MIVYLATNMAYFAAMTTTEILEADAVAVVSHANVQYERASLVVKQCCVFNTHLKSRPVLWKMSFNKNFIVLMAFQREISGSHG